MLSAGADIENRDGYNLQTAFMKAGQYRLRPLMNFLLSQGAKEGAYGDDFFTGEDLYQKYALWHTAPEKGGKCLNGWLLAQKRAHSIVSENGGWAGGAGYVSVNDDGEFQIPLSANLSQNVFAQPNLDVGFHLSYGRSNQRLHGR